VITVLSYHLSTRENASNSLQSNDMGRGRYQVLTRQPQTPPAHIRLTAPIGQRGTGDLRQYAKNGKNES